MKILIKLVDYIDQREEWKIGIECFEEAVKIFLAGVVLTAFGMVLAMLGGV